MDYLVHHGIKGQKWGVRRYQNEDGTLTAEGRKRYGKNIQRVKKRDFDNQVKAFEKSNPNSKSSNYSKKIHNEAIKFVKGTKEGKDFYDYDDLIVKLQKEAEKNGENIYFDSQQINHYNQLQEKAEKRYREYMHDPERLATYSSLLLKDLGYEDTEKGRKYVYKYLRGS